MTTPMRMTPWATTARLGSTSRNVMSVRMSWRMTTARSGPNDAAPTAGQAHPAEDDGSHAQQVYGPGTGVPIPVLAVSDRPPRAANRPVRA